MLRALGACGANIWCVRETKEEEEEKEERREKGKERKERRREGRSDTARPTDHVYAAVLAVHGRSVISFVSRRETHIGISACVYLVRTRNSEHALAYDSREHESGSGTNARVDAPPTRDSMRLKCRTEMLDRAPARIDLSEVSRAPARETRSHSDWCIAPPAIMIAQL